MLHAVQRILVQALLNDEPLAELTRQLAEADDLSAEERAGLQRLDADGMILTGLMVKKLRFERLIRGHPEMNELFRDQPHEFLRLFAAYTAAVPGTAYFPGEEADLFRKWHERQSEPNSF